MKWKWNANAAIKIRKQIVQTHIRLFFQRVLFFFYLFIHTLLPHLIFFSSPSLFLFESVSKFHSVFARANRVLAKASLVLLCLFHFICLCFDKMLYCAFYIQSNMIIHILIVYICTVSM